MCICVCVSRRLAKLLILSYLPTYLPSEKESWFSFFRVALREGLDSCLWGSLLLEGFDEVWRSRRKRRMALLSSQPRPCAGDTGGPAVEGVGMWSGEQQQQQSGALAGCSIACSHHKAASFGLGRGFGAGSVGFDAPWLIEVLVRRRRHSVEVEDREGEGESEAKSRGAALAAPTETHGEAIARYDIRRATEADIPLLGDIERSAGEVFRQVGLDAVADDEPMPEEVLRGYANAGQVWVAVASGGAVVGFLACFPIAQQDSSQARAGVEGVPQTDAFLHIAELSVHGAHQKRGLGRRLLDTMFAEVAAQPSVMATGFTGDERWKRGARVVVRGFSLTTYRHLAFNKPFYERMGFREVAAGEIEGLVGRRGRELWEEEQAGILRPEMRCWMMRDL